MTRIVAGLAKGRRLQVPGTGTRPTSDRAREGLFNTLAAAVDLDGARVLDLYAGSGAIGLEALSRGASVAVLVESDRRAVQVLRRNVETVGLPGAVVAPMPVNRYVAEAPDAPFDLVFADPPYAVEARVVDELAVTLAGEGWLAPSAVVVVERAGRSAPVRWDGDRITPWGEKRYGEAVLWYGRAR